MDDFIIQGLKPIDYFAAPIFIENSVRVEKPFVLAEYTFRIYLVAQKPCLRIFQEAFYLLEGRELKILIDGFG